MPSGTIYGTTGNEYIDSKIEWSYTQNMDANSSTVTAALYYRRNNSGYTTYGTGSFSIQVGTATASASKTLTITENAWVKAIEHTATVAHNPDGTKTCYIGGWGRIPDTSLTSTTCNQTITLATIPRASTITSANSVTLGSRCNIVWTPASAYFYYKVKFALSGFSYTTEAFRPGITTSYTYTGYPVPMDVAKQFPNAKSGTMTATLYTYSDSGGTKQVGSASSKTFTVTLPNSSLTKPTISMSLSPVTPYTKFASLYIQGRSKVKASFTNGEGKYGATIASISMQVEGKKYTSPFESGEIGASGSVSVVGTVTDSRGYSNTVTKTINVIAYDAPYISPYEGYKKVVCERCQEDGTADTSGTYLHIKGTRNYTKINTNGIVNTCSVRCRYKPEGGSWSHGNGDGIGVLLNTDTSTDKFDVILPNIVTDPKLSYTIQLSIGDDTQLPSSMEFSIPSESITFELREGGKGAAFGKHSNTDNLFEVEWDAQFNNKASFAGIHLKEKEIRVEGDDNTYYPVHISPTYFGVGMTQPTFVGVGKALGSASGNWEGNHTNGTSPLSIGWLLRYNGWDGNGSYVRTLYKVEYYAPLIAHAEGFGNSAKGFVVYLRGGGATYNITCTAPFTVAVHLAETDISESSSAVVKVYPKTAIDNGGVLFKNTCMEDTVIEEGESDIWYYRKWSSGRAECWGKRHVTVDISTAWGTIYYGSVTAVEFPFEFISAPMCQVTAEFGQTSHSAWLCASGNTTKTSAPAQMICRPASVTDRGFYILYYAMGRWK